MFFILIGWQLSNSCRAFIGDGSGLGLHKKSQSSPDLELPSGILSLPQILLWQLMNTNTNKKLARKHLFSTSECHRTFSELFTSFITKRIYLFALFIIIFTNTNNFPISPIITYGNYIISLLAHMDHVNKHVSVNK